MSKRRNREAGDYRTSKDPGSPLSGTDPLCVTGVVYHIAFPLHCRLLWAGTESSLLVSQNKVMAWHKRALDKHVQEECTTR